MTKDFALIMTANSGTAFMNHMAAVALAFHVAAVGGLQVHTGIIVMASSITALIMRPVAGRLSETFGRVKLLIIGAIICTVASVAYGLTTMIPMLILLRAVLGIGFGMHSTCAGAAAVDILPKSRVAEGIGIFGLGATLAQAAGPGLAMFIIAGGTLSDYRMLFLATGGMCAISAIANMCITYERKRKKDIKCKADHDNITAEPENAIQAEAQAKEKQQAALPKTFLGFEYAVFSPMISLTFMIVGFAGLILYLPVFAVNTGIGNPALYFLFSAIGVFISRMIFGRIVDRRGSDIVVIPGTIVMALAFFVIPHINTLVALFALGMFLGFAQGAVMPTFNAIFFKRCSTARRGTASGAHFSAIDIGFAIGGLFHGRLVDVYGYAAVFRAGGVLMILSLLVYILIASDKRYENKGRKS